MAISEVSFTVDGLLRCAASLYRPDGVAGTAPCVVMGHGFTLTRGDGIPDYAERFAAAGLVVLAFDYRHWGGSEASRGAGYRSVVSSRIGAPPWHVPVGWRAWTQTASLCGACPSPAPTH